MQNKSSFWKIRAICRALSALCVNIQQHYRSYGLIFIIKFWSN